MLLALRLWWWYSVDCFENALRCFGIGGRVPSIYVRRPFPFKHTVYRMEIQSTWFKTPIPTIGSEVFKWNQWEAACFFAAKFQRMWTATQLRKNIYPEFKKVFLHCQNDLDQSALQVWSRHAVEKGAVDAQPGLVDTLAFLNGIYEYLEV